MRTTNKNKSKFTKSIFIPRDWLDYGHKSFDQMRIVPPEFCKKVTLKAESSYNILPYWYKQCKALQSLEDNEIGRTKNYLPEHVKMLSKLQAYRKTQLLQEQLMRKLMH